MVERHGLNEITQGQIIKYKFCHKRRKCQQEEKHCDRGSLGTHHPRFLFKESLQEGKEGC